MGDLINLTRTYLLPNNEGRWREPDQNRGLLAKDYVRELFYKSCNKFSFTHRHRFTNSSVA